MYHTAAIPIATAIRLTVSRSRTDVPFSLPGFGGRLDYNPVLFPGHGKPFTHVAYRTKPAQL